MSSVSVALGNNTLEAEVTHISRHGFWMLVGGRELFLSFQDFPWFREASVAAIHEVEWPHARHLFWPQLDIDLSVESIEHPERFPLLAKA